MGEVSGGGAGNLRGGKFRRVDWFWILCIRNSVFDIQYSIPIEIKNIECPISNFECRNKSMFKISSLAYKRLILFNPALDFST